MVNNNIKEENLVSLPHNFVGGFNGQHWCVWECIEDFHRGFYPYEGDFAYKNGQPISKKMLCVEDAVLFAKRCHKSLTKKYGEKYNG